MSKMNVTRGSGAISPRSTKLSWTGDPNRPYTSEEVRPSVIDAQALGDSYKEGKADLLEAKRAFAKRNAGIKTSKGGGNTGKGGKAGKVVAAAGEQQTSISASLNLEAGLAPEDTSNDSNVGPNTGVGLYGYKWNLPPHTWSLPVEPSENSFAVNSEAYTLGALPSYRRGRIYYYSRIDTAKVDTSKYNTGSKGNSGDNSKDPRYGFQFLWNPETFSTSVAVNMDITPTWKDAFVSVVGAFPSGEYLSVQFRIDRTNDFACIKSLPSGLAADGTDVYKKYADSYGKYYSGGVGLKSLGFDSFTNTATGQNLGEKISELQQLGTLADIEYLYKAINGPGWTNRATGKDTSDIGFLMPTLLRIDIGPLSYLGYVNNMNVNHISFNKAMVPTRTDVSLQFNLMATAGLSSR